MEDKKKADPYDILSALPGNRSSKLTDADYFTLLNNSLEIENGKVLYNGTPVVDTKTFTPLSIAKVVSQIFSERNWIDGQATNTTPIFTRLSEVKDFIIKQGLSLNGEKAAAIIAAAVKNNSSFDTRS